MKGGIGMKRHMKIITVLILICVFMMGIYTVFLEERNYVSKVNIQVDNDLLDKKIYIEMINGSYIRNQAAKRFHLDKEVIKEALSAIYDDHSERIIISATTSDSQLSDDIVYAVSEVFINEMKENFDASINQKIKINNEIEYTFNKNCRVGIVMGIVLSLIDFSLEKIMKGGDVKKIIKSAGKMLPGFK